MIHIQREINPDIIGFLASGLCLVHCLITPIIFIVKVCTATKSCCANAPLWWQVIDYVFLVISFVAILYATKKSTTKWIQFMLWSSWSLLLMAIVSESLGLEVFHKTFIHIPAIVIMVLHYYNLKYCQCTMEQCCQNN